ncbi:MAG: FecR domain-containing protein [Spirochaetales bacterium]|nr:FecR domain-containing protein [Spirochaetales bacterium]
MKKGLLYFIIGCLSAVMISAQDTPPVGILEYYSDELEIQVFDADGTPVPDLYFGMELEEGDKIATGNSTAELRLDPNGTIIRLSYQTSFAIETFQRDQGSANQFALFAGKLRTVAAKTGLWKSNYSIKTPSAVCGVRGTDFGLEAIDGITDTAFVREGVVEFTSLINGQTLELTAGTTANVFDQVFEAVELSREQMDMLFSDLEFETLNPADVPGQNIALLEEPPLEEPVEEPPVEEPAPVQVTPPVVAETPQEPVEETGGPKEESAFYRWLSQYMGMEIGTLTIDGVTYSKAVLQPLVSVGKLRAGLYLPIIYTTNMFDSDDWYKPGGNSEWSFGTDYDDAVDIAKDAVQDLVLKIKFIEYGDQRDPFYIKAGNLKTMSIGHGILMQNYANDINFPAIRKIGLNMGLNGQKAGMEFIGDDLSDLSILGGRLFYKPVTKLSLGISGIIDMTPERGLEEYYTFLNETLSTEFSYGDSGAPIFLTGALDADFSIVESDFLSMVLFSDIAGMVPYYRSDVFDAPMIEQGLAIEALYDDSESAILDRFRNWGLMAGIIGNVTLFDYRLEYRHFNGTFRAPFFGPAYERMKGGYVNMTNAYLAELYSGSDISEEFTMTTRGIYGQGGMNILDILYVEAGYFLPWNEDGFTDQDEFHFMVSVPKGTIPFIDLSGYVSYDKIMFVDGLSEGKLFDENAVIKGEVVYPIAPTLDLAAIVTTSMNVNEDGDTEVSPVISIETRIHF